jgi:hypothetical protein
MDDGLNVSEVEPSFKGEDSLWELSSEMQYRRMRIYAVLLRGHKLTQNFGCDYRSGFRGVFVLEDKGDRFKKRIYNFKSFLKNQRKRMARGLLYPGHAST